MQQIQKAVNDGILCRQCLVRPIGNAEPCGYPTSCEICLEEAERELEERRHVGQETTNN